MLHPFWMAISLCFAASNRPKRTLRVQPIILEIGSTIVEAAGIIIDLTLAIAIRIGMIAPNKRTKQKDSATLRIVGGMTYILVLEVLGKITSPQ